MLPSRGFFKKNDCPFFEKGLCMRPHCHFRHKKKVVNENSSSADSQEDTLLENLSSIPLLDIEKTENNTSLVCENKSSNLDSQHSKSNINAVEDNSSQDSLFAKLVNQTNTYEKISRHIPCDYTPTPQIKSAQPKNKTVSSKNSVNSSVSINLLSKPHHFNSSVYNSVSSKDNLSNKDIKLNSLKSLSLNKVESQQATVCKNLSSCDSEYNISLINKNEDSMHYEPQSTSNSIFNEGNKDEDAASNYVPSKVTTSESKYTPNTNDSLLPNDYIPSKDKPKKEKYIPEPTGNITNHIYYKPSDKSSAGETQYHPEIKPGTSNSITDYIPTQKTLSQATSGYCTISENKNILADFEFITSEIEMMKKLLNDDSTQSDKEKESKTDLDKSNQDDKTATDLKEKSLKNHDKSSFQHKSTSSHSDLSKSSKDKDSSSSRHHSSGKSESNSDRHKSSSKRHKKSTSNSSSSRHNSKSHKDREKSKKRNSHDKKKKSYLESTKKKDDKAKSDSGDGNVCDDLCDGEKSNSGGESIETEQEENFKKRKKVFSDDNNKAKILKKSEILISDLDDDADEDPDAVEKECLEIFNSYSNQIESNQIKKTNEIVIEDQDIESQNQGKKRTAHSTTIMSDHAVLRHKTAKKLNTLKSAQEVMMERYKKVEKAKETPIPTLQPPQPILGLNRPSVRIAAVSNIQQMLQAKKAIEEKINKGLKINERSTIAKSVSHSGSRIAHTPVSKEMTERPTISTGTKQIPRVKRQIYLDKLLLETNQIFPTKSESAEEALKLEEEVFRANSASFSAYHAAYISLLMKTKRRVAAVKGETSSLNTNRPKVSHSDVLSGGKKNFSVIKTKRVDISMLSDRHIYDELFRCKLSPEELKENGYPVAGAKYGYATCSFNFELKYNTKYLHIKKMTGNRRYCIRCSKQYEVNPATLKQYKEGPETCSYHPGKKKSGGRNCERVYNCCNSSSSEGCTTHVRHVTDCNNYDNLPNCVRTLCKGEANPEVFALDCEMVYTTLGYELARVTVVNLKKEVVYDTLVKPKHPIECYNTFYSGIEENMMEGVETTLKDVQAVLLSMFSDKTIIIGHSLDSDLRALHLIHDTVVDTAIIYKNEKYHPYKYSLKDLCAKKISKIIQNNVNGHDSAEDAIAALEIMLNHVKEEVSKYDSLESYEADRKG